MRLKTIPIKAKPKEGDIREQKKFAWLPRKVGDKLIWLEQFIIVSRFTVRERMHDFRQYGIMKVTGGGWDEIEKKVIDREGLMPLKKASTGANHWGGEPLNTSKNAHS